MPNSTLNQIKRNITEDNIIKSIKNLLKKINAITDKIIRDIHIVFEENEEDEDYYKPVRVCSAFNDNFIEYESKQKVIKVKRYRL